MYAVCLRVMFCPLQAVHYINVKTVIFALLGISEKNTH